MKAIDALREVLYRAQNTEQKGLMTNNNCEGWVAIHAYFGKHAEVIEGQMEEGATYMYDYSEETSRVADVTIKSHLNEAIYLTKIED